MKKRVHVAPLGYELDRIVEPLKELKADEFILVIQKEEKHGKEHQKNVENWLKEHDVKYSIKEAELLDLEDCISVFGRIVYRLKEEGHDVYVNISSSTSISAVGASFAAMLWDAEPYHALPEYIVHEHEREPGEPMSQGLKDVIPIQGLHFEIPDRELLKILKYIDDHTRENKRFVSNKDVIDFLKEKEMLTVGDGVRNESQSLNKKFRERYRNDLVEKWDFIKLKGKTRSRKIGLTEKGRQYLKMFGYLV
ncbi:MAG: DUF6293 family protein [Candidatus Saliniplasma sp.]